MEITIPAALKALASAGSALGELAAWRSKTSGSTRALIGELRNNLRYLDMVAEDGVALAEVIDKLSVSEYRRLRDAGFNFNTLKRSRIGSYPSLKGTALESWTGKRTDELLESIYERIDDLVIRFPHVGNQQKYRWGVRVNNIRMRMWLLLKHVRS
jgi:hypothetical protein